MTATNNLPTSPLLDSVVGNYQGNTRRMLLAEFAQLVLDASGVALNPAKAFDTRAEAEAGSVAAALDMIFCEGIPYRRDALALDLVMGDGSRWARMSLSEQFPTAFLRSTDPAVLRAALGIAGDREAVTAAGTYVLDPARFMPNQTVYAVGASELCTVDVSGAVIGQTYQVYNLSALGGRVILDCGEEYGWLGMGATPTNLTTRQVILESGQVAYLSRPNLTRFHVWFEGDYWVSFGAGSRYRRCADGSYEVLYRRGATLAGTTEAADIALPTGFSLDAAVVQSVAIQPRSAGDAPGGAAPPIITKMGTTNGLAANAAAIYNPNSVAQVHPVVIHFTNVGRS